MTRRTRSRGAALALGLVLAVLYLTGRVAIPAQPTDSGPAPARPAPSVAELLDSLPVAVETLAGYDRDLFGHGWASGPGGCDTRQLVLAAEATTGAPDGCEVTGGVWVSVYDNQRVTDPTALDVDHLVPLAEAWASGAHAWDPERRRAFANDLEHRDALVAVTAAANRAKGDSDPAQWMPPDRDAWCWYATAWVTTKAAWQLTIDDAEHQALTDTLSGCPAQDLGVGR